MNKNQENAERMQQLVDDLNLKTEKIKLGKEKIAKTRCMKIIANRLTCVCVKKKVEVKQHVKGIYLERRCFPETGKLLIITHDQV